MQDLPVSTRRQEFKKRRIQIKTKKQNTHRRAKIKNRTRNQLISELEISELMIIVKDLYSEDFDSGKRGFREGLLKNDLSHACLQLEGVTLHQLIKLPRKQLTLSSPPPEDTPPWLNIS